MSDATPPNPYEEPPSINEAVREHLDVIHEMRELRRTTEQLAENQSATAIAVNSLANDLGRHVDRLTSDGFTLVRVERRLTSLEQKFDSALGLLVQLAKHLGVQHG